MKRSFLYAAFLFLAVLLVGCKERQTPDTDTTKLWPAYDVELQRWGFANSKGLFEIEPAFKYVTGFSCGYARVWFGSATGTPMFVSKCGKPVVGAYDYAEDFYYKRSLVEFDGLYAFMNTSFENVFQPIFNSLGRLSKEGLAPAQLDEDGLFGYVNEDGEMEIPATYDRASAFDGGVAVVRKEEKYGAINTKNAYVVPLTGNRLQTIGEGLIAYYEQDGKVGAYNDDGKVVIQPIYDEVGYCFDNDLVPVRYNGKYGYVNKKGEQKIDVIYDYASCFYEGYAAVEKDGRCQFIDTKGNPKIRLKDRQEVVTLFHNGLALVCTYSEEDGTTGPIKYDYIDTKGNVAFSWTVQIGGRRVGAKKPMLQTSRELIEMTQHFDSRKL